MKPPPAVFLYSVQSKATCRDGKRGERTGRARQQAMNKECRPEEGSGQQVQRRQQPGMMSLDRERSVASKIVWGI